MKNVFTILTLLLFTVGGFSQNTVAQSAVVKGNEKELNANLEANVFEFSITDGATCEDITKAASFYKDYFTVECDATSLVSKITFISDDDLARRVVNRFFLTANIRTIVFQEKSFTIMEFYSNYLKK